MSTAALNGHSAVARLLLDAGADLEAKDVVSAAADVTWPPTRVDVPVHAIVARLLLDAGADVDARDEVSGRAAGGRGAVARAGLWHPPSRFAPCRMATRRS